MTEYSEFEVQAVAYFKIKEKYPNIKGEYCFPCPFGTKRGARFDLALFNNQDELILVIEVKRSDHSKAKAQKERYEKLTGVECIYIKGMRDAVIADEIVAKCLSNYIEITPLTSKLVERPLVPRPRPKLI